MCIYSAGRPSVAQDAQLVRVKAPEALVCLHRERQQQRTDRGLDHDVGASDQRVEDPDTVTALQVEGDGSLLPVQEGEEGAGAAARSVRSLRRLDLRGRGRGLTRASAAGPTG